MTSWSFLYTRRSCCWIGCKRSLEATWLRDAIVSAGDSATRAVTPLTDADMFQVRPNQLGKIRFTVTPTASIDVKLEPAVFGSPLGVANTVGPSLAEVLETDVQQLEHRFLVVRNVGRSTGNYTFGVTKVMTASAPSPICERATILTPAHSASRGLHARSTGLSRAPTHLEDVRSLLLLAILVTGCAAKPSGPTVRGADLYDHVGELRATGRALVRWDKRTVEVRASQFLIDRSRDQVFSVEQVIANCRGTGIYDDPNCTLVLMRDQKLSIVDEAPKPRDPEAEEADIDDLTKARLVVAAVGVPLVIGAFKCDAFDGCGEALGVAAGIDALLLLVLFTGLH